MGVSAQNARKIITSTNANDDKVFYYYNVQNRLVQQISNTTRYDFTYNDAGQCVKKQMLMWVSATGEYSYGSYELYEYGADGNVSKTTVMKRPYGSTEYVEDDVFTNYTYEDGFQKTWDNYYKGVLYYQYRNVITKNSDGDIETVVTEQFDPDAPDKGWAKKNEMKYVWANLSAAMVPGNLVADNKNGNITLTWNAVAGAEKYIVSYDQTRTEVAGTTYNVTLDSGNHRIAVQAVVDGKELNAAFAEVNVSDPGNVPVEQLSVGKCYVTIEETESAEAPTREFYNIPLSWTMPESHSAVKSFRIYYNSRTFGETYQAVEATVLNYTLKIDPYEVRDVDADGNLTNGIATNIYMTVMYDTGESAKSNVVTVNAYDEISGVETIESDVNALNAKTYNIAGQEVNNAKGLVIKNGKKMICK